MKKNKQMDISFVKHTGKSVVTDSGAKRISIKFNEWDSNTDTLYSMINNAYGIIFEDNFTVTITKGGHTIKNINKNEFFEKLLK